MTPEERERERRWKEYHERMDRAHDRFRRRLLWALVLFVPINMILISVHADDITSLLVAILVGLAIIIATY